MKKLYNIKSDIYNMSTREECISRCINEKLNVSLYNFDKEINSVCDSLLSSNTLRVLKNLVKSKEN